MDLKNSMPDLLRVLSVPLEVLLVAEDGTYSGGVLVGPDRSAVGVPHSVGPHLEVTLRLRHWRHEQVLLYVVSAGQSDTLAAGLVSSTWTILVAVTELAEVYTLAWSSEGRQSALKTRHTDLCPPSWCWPRDCRTSSFPPDSRKTLAARPDSPGSPAGRHTPSSAVSGRACPGRWRTAQARQKCLRTPRLRYTRRPPPGRGCCYTSDCRLGRDSGRGRPGGGDREGGRWRRCLDSGAPPRPPGSPTLGHTPQPG